MHTEADAKELECRSVGVVLSQTMMTVGHSIGGGHAGGTSYAVPALERAMCIASKCAMWRWLDQPPANRVAGEDSWLGYCGLAGRPEVA